MMKNLVLAQELQGCRLGSMRRKKLGITKVEYANLCMIFPLKYVKIIYLYFYKASPLTKPGKLIKSTWIKMHIAIGD